MATKKRGVSQSVKEAVAGAIRSADDVAQGVVDTVSGTLAAALRGGRQMTGEALGLVYETVGGAVQSVAQAGGDVTIAASGALEAVGEMSSTAAERVRKAVGGTISGVKVVLRKPVKREGREKRGSKPKE